MSQIEIRDLRRKQYFQVDDAYLNGYAKLCGIYATGVYMSLCRHANKKQQSWPSIELVAEELAINKQTVLKAITTLEEWGIIEVLREKDEKTKRQKPNVYTLTDKPSWKAKPSTPDVPRPEYTTDTDPSTPQIKKPSTPGVLEGNTVLKDTQLKESPHTPQGGKSYAKLIFEELYKINPAIPFNNPTQWKDADWLVNNLGGEKALGAAKAAVAAYGKEYAPVITTVSQLKSKLSALRVFYAKNKTNIKSTHVIL